MLRGLPLSLNQQRLRSRLLVSHLIRFRETDSPDVFTFHTNTNKPNVFRNHVSVFPPHPHYTNRRAETTAHLNDGDQTRSLRNCRSSFFSLLSIYRMFITFAELSRWWNDNDYLPFGPHDHDKVTTENVMKQRPCTYKLADRIISNTVKQGLSNVFETWL